MMIKESVFYAPMSANTKIPIFGGCTAPLLRLLNRRPALIFSVARVVGAQLYVSYLGKALVKGKMRIYPLPIVWIAVLAIWLTVLPSWRVSPTPKVIVFFGDSITAGFGLSSKKEAFPALVAAHLKAQGKNVQVVNAGLSGETSAGGLNRIDWVLQRPCDIFVLELGGNDALRGLPNKNTEANLQGIIDRVKALCPKAKIVLAGMEAPPNLGKEYADAFRNVYSNLAKRNDVTLIPFLLKDVGGNARLNLPDGIHPNKEGHQIVSRTVLHAIAPLL